MRGPAPTSDEQGRHGAALSDWGAVANVDRIGRKEGH